MNPEDSYSLSESILLGAIQGLTEFLPVSSSAHLIFFSSILGGHVLPLALNIGFHVGTLLALLGYFWRDWFGIIGSFFRLVIRRERSFNATTMLPALVIGSIPAGFLGVFFKDSIEQTFHHPIMTVMPLILFGLALWLTDKRFAGNRRLSSLSIMDALFIGAAQAIALIPGSSRSGCTIMGGRILGFSRQESARFSFLLGTPAMLGAALLDHEEIVSNFTNTDFLVGVATAGIVGGLAIHFLLNFLKKQGFLVFAIYRIILGIAILFTVYR